MDGFQTFIRLLWSFPKFLRRLLITSTSLGEKYYTNNSIWQVPGTKWPLEKWVPCPTSHPASSFPPWCPVRRAPRSHLGSLQQVMDIRRARWLPAEKGVRGKGGCMRDMNCGENWLNLMLCPQGAVSGGLSASVVTRETSWRELGGIWQVGLWLLSVKWIQFWCSLKIFLIRCWKNY